MLEYFLLSRAYNSATNVSADAASARATAQAASHSVDRLEQRLGAMELAVETLLRGLIQSGKLSEEEFFQLARQIDMEDGVMDGRRDMNKLRKVCPQCSKASPADRHRCMWCGTDVLAVKAERPVL